MKAQSFYTFMTKYYGDLQLQTSSKSYRQKPDSKNGALIIKPHYAIEAVFLIFTDVSASVTQQLIQYPMS